MFQRPTRSNRMYTKENKTLADKRYFVNICSVQEAVVSSYFSGKNVHVSIFHICFKCYTRILYNEHENTERDTLDLA